MPPNVAKAEKIIRDKKVSYHVRNETGGLGNCFFLAMADQLTNGNISSTISQRAKNIAHDHVSIRKAIVKFMSKCPEFYNDAVVIAWLNLEETNEQAKPVHERRTRNQIWLEHLEMMSTPGEFAWETVVKAAAMFFGKDIFVISETTALTLFGSMTNQQVTGDPMAVVHMDQCHFQSVHRHSELPPAVISQSIIDPNHVKAVVSEMTNMSFAKSDKEFSCKGCTWSGNSLESLKRHLERTGSGCRNIYDIDAPDSEVFACRGCQFVGKLLGSHLERKTGIQCQQFYDMNAIELLKKGKKRVDSTRKCGKNSILD